MIARALVALCATTSLAAAESIVPTAPEPPPDPAVAAASEANLESRSWRDNIIVTFGVGASFTLGFGIEDAVGRGGSTTLRIGKVASPSWLVTLEVSTYALLHSFSNKLYTNTEATLLVGGQYYVRPKLWLRIAGGVGFYRGEMVALETGGRGDQRLAGLASTVGGGLDLKRWGRFGFGLELASTALLTRDGLLSSNGMLLTAVID